MSYCRIILIILTFSTFLFSATKSALADHPSSKARLHFSHPIITESPSPDTKARFDYIFLEDADGGESSDHTLNLELEYAFTRNISIELDVPYTFRDFSEEPNENHFDNIGLGLKLANFSLENYGILLGGGVEFEFPTGDDDEGIGSDEVFEVAPFLSFGYKMNKFEFISFLELGFPFNDGSEDESAEFEYNASVLYHAIENFLQVLFELNGEVAIEGEEEGFSVLNLTPGVKITPFNDKNLALGVGFSFPVTDDKEFDFGLTSSIFYHF